MPFSTLEPGVGVGAAVVAFIFDSFILLFFLTALMPKSTLNVYRRYVLNNDDGNDDNDATTATLFVAVYETKMGA